MTKESLLEKLREKNRTVLEMELGILALAILFQIASLPFPGDRPARAVSLFLGCLMAFLAVLHMYRTLDRALDLVEDGSVILMHDLYQATAEASVDLIPALNDAGYKMVTISELAEAYGYTLEPGGIYYAFYPGGCEYNMGPEELLEAAKEGYTA